MKKRKKMSGRRFKTTASRPLSKPPIIEMEAEEFVPYIRQAEQKVLSSIKEMKLGAGAAAFLLAQHTQVLATGDPRISVESAMAVVTNVLALWQAGYYTPGPEYPFTLEETLRGLEGEVEAQEDFAAFFQPFAPLKAVPPRGIAQVAGGIVKHPETNLWQIWMIVEEACGFFGAYRDPRRAQRGLEEIINAHRRNGTEAERHALAKKVQSQGDGTPKQLPFNLMEYLVGHLDLYQIQL